MNEADHQRAGTVSLTNDGVATTTAVTHHGVSSNSVVVLSATNAAAATEVGAGGLYVTKTKGSFTIHHSASVSARTFDYIWHNGKRV